MSNQFQSATLAALDEQITKANAILQTITYKNELSYTVVNNNCRLTLNGGMVMHEGHPRECERNIDGFVLGYLVGRGEK